MDLDFRLARTVCFDWSGTFVFCSCIASWYCSTKLVVGNQKFEEHCPKSRLIYYSLSGQIRSVHTATWRVQLKPSQVIILPIAKSQTRSKHNKDKHKCSSVYSERGVLLPVLTSGGVWVGVRACKISKILCNATHTYDPANPPPCACRARLRGLCSTRPIRVMGPEPLHPHVCGPHVALEVGDHLMLLTIRRRYQVSLFLARVGRTCTLDRRVNE
jgi:hypothetical protein